MASTRPVKRARISNGDNFNDPLTSEPFLFIVGPEKKEFRIHKDLVARLSPVLDSLVNGRMREATEGRVEWPDVDIDTFRRFAEFAYSGDYKEAEPELLVPLLSPDTADSDEVLEDQSNNSDSSDEIEEDDGDPYWYAKCECTAETVPSKIICKPNTVLPFLESKSNDNPREYIPNSLPYSIAVYCKRVQNICVKCGRLIEEDEQPGSRRPAECKMGWVPTKWARILVPAQWLKSVHPGATKKYKHLVHCARSCLSVLAIRQSNHVHYSWCIWEPRPNPSPHESYQPVFSSHARLYILADKYGIEILKTLVLYRLHFSLMRFHFHIERVSDVISLAEEIYENTVQGDRARSVVSLYISCFAEHIKSSEAFRELIKRGGDLAQDVVDETVNRMRDYPC